MWIPTILQLYCRSINENLADIYIKCRSPEDKVLKDFGIFTFGEGQKKTVSPLLFESREGIITIKAIYVKPEGITLDVNFTAMSVAEEWGAKLTKAGQSRFLGPFMYNMISTEVK